MIAIIGAMDEEVAILKDAISIKEEEKIAHVEFTVGTLHNKDVVLLKSGIGKVNASIAATLLMQNFDVEAVINTGSAGGIKENANVLDLVISESVVYHDVDVTGFNYEYGQVPGLPASFESDKKLVVSVAQILKKANASYIMGQIATGDAFVNKPSQLETVKRSFPKAVALEMEAAAVAQVCYLFKKPFVVVRALSDIAGKESHLSFDEFLVSAARVSSDMVSELVKELSFNGASD